MEINKNIVYVISGLLLLGLLLMTFFPGLFFNGQSSTVTSGKDICQPEPGYTDQEWKEHMGHHPDVYKDCLT